MRSARVCHQVARADVQRGRCDAQRRLNVLKGRAARRRILFRRQGNAGHSDFSNRRVDVALSGKTVDQSIQGVRYGFGRLGERKLPIGILRRTDRFLRLVDETTRVMHHFDCRDDDLVLSAALFRRGGDAANGAGENFESVGRIPSCDSRVVLVALQLRSRRDGIRQSIFNFYLFMFCFT